jgi:sugar/nucleoside kinase (ribokinase family)
VAGRRPPDAWRDVLHLRDCFAVPQVYACSASPLSKDDLVDSTGAGDAFIASIIYGLVRGKTIPELLTLATVVAARKCTELGARPGIPKREDLAPHLL